MQEAGRPGADPRAGRAPELGERLGIGVVQAEAERAVVAAQHVAEQAVGVVERAPAPRRLGIAERERGEDRQPAAAPPAAAGKLDDELRPFRK